jgi:hypothetical protein
VDRLWRTYYATYYLFIGLYAVRVQSELALRKVGGAR